MPARSCVDRGAVRRSRLLECFLAVMLAAPVRAHGQIAAAELEPLVVPNGTAIACASSTDQQKGQELADRRSFTVKGDRLDERRVQAAIDSTGTLRTLIDVVAKVVDDHPTLTVVTVHFSPDSVFGSRRWYRTVAALSMIPPDSTGAFREMKFPLSAAEGDAATKLATWLAAQRCTESSPKSKAPTTIL